MPIATANLPWHLTILTALNAAQGDPNLSLGRYVSSTVAPTTLNGLFDAITADRNAAGEIDYRCVVVRNTHATLTLTNARVWLDGGDPAGGANVAIALDTTGNVPYASGTQALAVATSDTVPGAAISGLAYSTPVNSAGGLLVGNLAPGQCRAVWVRRTAMNTAAVASELIKLTITGDTLG